jgi:ABC-type uncharacterized transport system substrate-binding protein
MISDAMLFDTHERIATFALEERMPTIAPSPEQAESGMLFAYGTSRPEMYRQAATYVKKILAGKVRLERRPHSRIDARVSVTSC